VAAAQEAIARHQRLGDTEELAGAHVRLTLGYYQIAQFEDALAASERALSLFNDAGRNRSLHYGAALSCRALALIGLGRHAEAREGFTACIALIEALGDGERAAGARINLAELDFAQGDVASAIANIDTALLVVRGRVPAAETAALLNAAAYRLVLGEIPAAHRAAADALRLTRRLGSAPLRTFSLQHLATVAALKGDVKRAAALLGYIDACLAREGLARGPTEARTFEILASSLEERLTADERNELAAAGRSLSDSEAIELALSIHAS
jgi:tetratricopeptide (TPR) repeat protein